VAELAICSTVRENLDDLTRFVNFHLNVGVSKIILFFDDPEDEGISFFGGRDDVIVVPCDDEHWQRTTGGQPYALHERLLGNREVGLKMAQDLGCDWYAMVDSDELIYPGGSLSGILDASKVDVLVPAMREAIPEKDRYQHIFEPDHFKLKSGKISGKIKIWLAKVLGCKSAIYENRYFRGHGGSKSLVRMSAVGKIHEYGSHGPRRHDRSLKKKQTSKIELLHYDCIGIENWSQKWEQRTSGSVVSRRMKKNRRMQVDAYLQAKKRGPDALAALYNSMFVIPPREMKILNRLGMVKRIELDPALFREVEPGKRSKQR
jgi:hypothetical protein